MVANDMPFAISGIKEPEKIRILIYANNEMVHAPLPAVLKAGITSGNNENGDYVRFADGTQICWSNTSPVMMEAQSEDKNAWTFPMPFAALPVVTITPVASNGALTTSISKIDHAMVAFDLNVANKSDVGLQKWAIGRWF